LTFLLELGFVVGGQLD